MSFTSAEVRQQYYKSMLDQLIVEIDAMVKLRGKAHIVAYEEHKVVPKENQPGYDLFLRMELLRSLNSYQRDKGGLNRNDVIKLGVDIA